MPCDTLLEPEVLLVSVEVQPYLVALYFSHLCLPVPTVGEIEDLVGHQHLVSHLKGLGRRRGRGEALLKRGRVSGRTMSQLVERAVIPSIDLGRGVGGKVSEQGRLSSAREEGLGVVEAHGPRTVSSVRDEPAVGEGGSQESLGGVQSRSLGDSDGVGSGGFGGSGGGSSFGDSGGGSGRHGGNAGRGDRAIRSGGGGSGGGGLTGRTRLVSSHLAVTGGSGGGGGRSAARASGEGVRLGLQQRALARLHPCSGCSRGGGQSGGGGRGGCRGGGHGGG